MSTVYSVHEAKTHLSKLLRKVEEGETVQISRSGTIVAKITKVISKNNEMELGFIKGNYNIPDDFNDEDPEINEMFYGQTDTNIKIENY